jgi:hypothetical protein
MLVKNEKYFLCVLLLLYGQRVFYTDVYNLEYDEKPWERLDG